MIIAHAPSGYVLATSILRRIANVPVSAKVVIAAGILGALAPDFDMLYFHFVDGRQTHHHRYPSHWPIIWFGLAAASLVWLGLARQSKAALPCSVFCLGGALHMLLDSFVGDVWWFAPFIDRPYALFSVPARFDPWWLSFVLHWSFALELAIWIWALRIYRERSRINSLLQGHPPTDTAQMEPNDATHRAYPPDGGL